MTVVAGTAASHCQINLVFAGRSSDPNQFTFVARLNQHFTEFVAQRLLQQRAVPKIVLAFDIEYLTVWGVADAFNRLQESLKTLRVSSHFLDLYKSGRGVP